LLPVKLVAGFVKEGCQRLCMSNSPLIELNDFFQASVIVPVEDSYLNAVHGVINQIRHRKRLRLTEMQGDRMPAIDAIWIAAVLSRFDLHLPPAMIVVNRCSTDARAGIPPLGSSHNLSLQLLGRRGFQCGKAFDALTLGCQQIALAEARVAGDVPAFFSCALHAEILPLIGTLCVIRTA
jgi:hypothetical protein